MKNLFEYAKKELTQDAVIAWLLESGNIGKALLLNMCPQLKNDIQENGTEIEELVVNTQTESIDILVEVKLSNGKTTAVIIEDKTDTYLHDFQMLKYIANTANKNENRSKKKYNKVHFVLFKTGDMHYWEVQDFNYWISEINEKKRVVFKPDELNQDVNNVLVSSSYLKSKIEFPNKKNKTVPVCVEALYTLKKFNDFLDSDCVPKDNLILNYYKDYLKDKCKQQIGTNKEEYKTIQSFAKQKDLHLEVVKANGGGKREYEYNLISKEFIIGEKGSNRFLILPIIAKDKEGDSVEYQYIIQCQLVTEKKTIHGYVPWNELKPAQRNTFSAFKTKVFESFKEELENNGWNVRNGFSKGCVDRLTDDDDTNNAKDNGLRLCAFGAAINQTNLDKLIDTATMISEFVKDNYKDIN